MEPGPWSLLYFHFSVRSLTIGENVVFQDVRPLKLWSSCSCEQSADLRHRSVSMAAGGHIAGVWGRESPAGSRGRALVGGLGDKAPRS